MKYLKVATLTKGYCDPSKMLLHAAFQTLVDFVEKEKPGEIINWNYDAEHKQAWKEIKYLYRWWTKTRPARRDAYEHAGFAKLEERLSFDELFAEPETLSKEKRRLRASYRRLSAKCAELEERQGAEDQANLHRLIAVRQYLWT